MTKQDVSVKIQLSKKEIFYFRFNHYLKNLLLKHQSVITTGSINTVFKGVATVGAGATLGGTLGHIGGESLMGSGSTGRIVGGLAGGSIAAKKAFNDYTEIKKGIKYSENIIKLLAKESLINNIKDNLYFEFQFAIEMLSTATNGIDRLVKFFVKKISKSFSRELSSESDDEIFDFLFFKIHDDRVFSEEKRLELTCETHHDHNWKLDELILHSPALLITLQETGQNKGIYFFQIFSNLFEKRRFQFNKLSFTAKAEGSHKYPVRILQDKKSLLSLRNFTEVNAFIPQTTSTWKIHSLETKAGEISIRTLNPLMTDLYFFLRKNRYDNAYFHNCINILLKIIPIVAQNIIQDPFTHLIFIQNLRNICFQENLLNIKDKQYRNNQWQNFNKEFYNLEKKYVVDEKEIKKFQDLSINLDLKMIETSAKIRTGILPPAKIIDYKKSEPSETLEKLIDKANLLAENCGIDKESYLQRIKSITTTTASDHEKKIKLRQVIALMKQPSEIVSLSSNPYTLSASSVSSSSSSSMTSPLLSKNSPTPYSSNSSLRG